ncbi:hypothetical protein THOM_2780 [Trachipleistophora hominis]|uniref:Zinc-ribbon 15 domain-containing protein n=1 Tax=Trachipleistophora hominis TaxID=72359 RepID=L7JS53_TRAHO|nr:hypothetical protein THOM_2780 [Trachipleistophora hominis]
MSHMCQCLICGVMTKIKSKKNENAVEDVYCPFCSNNVDAADIIHKYYFTFFFIPLFPVGSSTKYVGCEVCKGKFSDGRVRICHKCRNIILNDYRYCGRCGDAVGYL